MENIDNLILDELLNDDDDDDDEVEVEVEDLLIPVINDQGKEVNNNELCSMFQLYYVPII